MALFSFISESNIGYCLNYSEITSYAWNLLLFYKGLMN